MRLLDRIHWGLQICQVGLSENGMPNTKEASIFLYVGYDSVQLMALARVHCNSLADPLNPSARDDWRLVYVAMERQDRLQSLYSLTHGLAPNMLSSANPGSIIAPDGVEIAPKRRSVHDPNGGSGYPRSSSSMLGSESRKSMGTRCSGFPIVDE